MIDFTIRLATDATKSILESLNSSSTSRILVTRTLVTRGTRLLAAAAGARPAGLPGPGYSRIMILRSSHVYTTVTNVNLLSFLET